MSRSRPHHWHGGEAPSGGPVVVGGSVAGRLARAQHRPVMIIPPAARGSA